MSLSLSALRELVTIGLTAEQILRVAEAQAEAAEAPRQRTKAAERQARYEERKRQKASENVSSDVRNDASEADVSLLPPSPPNHPHPPASIIPPYPPRPGLVGSRRRRSPMVFRDRRTSPSSRPRLEALERTSTWRPRPSVSETMPSRTTGAAPIGGLRGGTGSQRPSNALRRRRWQPRSIGPSRPTPTAGAAGCASTA